MLDYELDKQKVMPRFAENLAEETMERGREDFRTQRWDEAVRKFRKVLEIKPDCADAHHWLGRAYSVIGSERNIRRERSVDAAIEAYKKAIELNPSFGPSHVHLANLYHIHKGMIDEAIVEYEKAARLDGMDDEARFAVCNNLGFIYRSKAMYEEALRWFSEATAIKPDVSYLPWRIAALYAIMGKAVETVIFLKRSLELGENPKRIESANGTFDKVRDTAEFQSFIQSLSKGGEATVCIGA